MITGHFIFPPQAISDAKKQDKNWQKKCIDAGISAISDRSETSIRKTRFNKLKNYNFWNFRLDKNEMKKVADPFGINPEEMPVDIKHYPLLNAKINTLAGEELKRRTEWVVRALSPDVVDAKKEQAKDIKFNAIMQLIESDEDFEPFKAKKKLEEVDDYLKYSLQDVREIKADRVLQWLWRNPEFDWKNQLNRCFYDLNIVAEEIAHIEIVNDEPVPRKCNPLNVYTLGQGDKIYIDESDVIIEDGYYNPGYIIDLLNEYLTEAEIKRIENKDTDTYHNPMFSTMTWGVPFATEGVNVVNTEIIEVDRQYGNQYGNMDGVYMARVTWKSLRKLGDLTYFDNEGIEQHTIVPEGYKPNKFKGEKVTWFWETEWWEGLRVMDDIYVKVRPVPGNKCPYVGIVSNVNVNRAMSLMDTGKSLNMLYDIFMYRLEMAYAKYKGPLIELDLAKKPDNWTEAQWLHYAENMSYLIIDSFREINKGVATGTLAGSMNTTGKVLNPDISGYIQQTQLMLMHIRKEIDEVTGVSPERQGASSALNTVGQTERSVASSSNNTEYWFNLHTKFIERFLNRFLAFSEYAWRNKKKQLQYIMGDLSTVVDEINGEELEGINPCVFVTSSPEDAELLKLVRQAVMDSVKQGSGSMSNLLDTFYSNSMSEIRKKLLISEEKRSQLDQQKFEAEQAQIKEAAQREDFYKTEELRITEEDNVRKAEIEWAKINQELPTGENAQEIESPLERDKLNHTIEKDKEELQIKQKNIELKNKQLNDNKELKKEQLKIQARKKVGV